MNPRPLTSGHAAAAPDFQVRILTLPPAFGADVLSGLIELGEESIRTYRSVHPERLPPWCVLPGPRCVWLAEDVLQWIAQHRKARPSPAKKRGAPTKRARLARSVAAAVGGAA